MNDVLSEDDLAAVTGVNPRSRDKTRRMVEVFNHAGIHHWINAKGRVITTWHHVHRSGLQKSNIVKSAGPKFGRIA